MQVLAFDTVMAPFTLGCGCRFGWIGLFREGEERCLGSKTFQRVLVFLLVDY
jgi:hypothetical protein